MLDPRCWMLGGLTICYKASLWERAWHPGSSIQYRALEF
jgi:hypothetical protein